MKERLYALHCADAYLQWFGGLDVGSMSPGELAYRQQGYEDACRRIADRKSAAVVVMSGARRAGGKPESERPD